MFIAVLELMPRNGQRQVLLDILRFVEEHVRSKTGCLRSGVFEAANDTQQVLYVEQWRSGKDLHAHIQSGLYLRLLNAMELAAEKPKISFHEVTQTRSMELIEELRGCQRANTDAI
jgi:quinol monooxygenase YgiN